MKKKGKKERKKNHLNQCDISPRPPTGIRKRRTLASRPPQFNFLSLLHIRIFQNAEIFQNEETSVVKSYHTNIPPPFPSTLVAIIFPTIFSFIFFRFTGIQGGGGRRGEKKSITEGGEALHHGELKMMIGGKRAASRDGGEAVVSC